jgi:hypothetical protein
MMPGLTARHSAASGQRERPPPIQGGSRRRRATWLTTGIAMANAALIAVGIVLGAAVNG